MKNRKISAFLAGLALGLPSWVAADDIEVYTGASLSAGARPNVILVLDDSQSLTLGENRMLKGEFDPTITYPGTCHSESVYALKAVSIESPDLAWDAVFGNTYFFDDAASDGCDNYPIIERLAVAKYWDVHPTDPADAVDPVPENINTLRCVAARESLKKTGSYTDQFVYSPSWGGDTDWIYGLNLGAYSDVEYPSWLNGTDKTMSWYVSKYQCLGDGDLPAHADLSSPGNMVHVPEGLPMTLYAGNYLNWYFHHRQTRLDVLKQGVSKLLDNLPANVNLSLMPFSQNSVGAYVHVPMDDINVNREQIRAAVNGMTGKVGGTGIAESLYEAIRYYAGATVDTGSFSTPMHSVPASRDPNDPSAYKSPINLSCQQNHVVVITDGEPDGDSDRDTQIKKLPWLTSGAYGSCGGADNCADELASWMLNRDFGPPAGVQNIKTHAIGLGLPSGATFFGALTTAGGGRYIAAQTADDLATSLQNLFKNEIMINGTFVAPAVSVNAFNRSQHRNELYFAVFDVGDKARWNGNLKKYQIKKLSDGTLAIVDVNAAPALDSATGEFSSGAQSWWSGTVDGNDPVKGGANDRLGTWAANNTPRSLWTNVAPGPHIITADNRLSSASPHITAALTGAADETESDAWLDAFTSGRFQRMYGDPLHSRPVVVNYDGTDANPVAAIFFTTNDGMLHALDPGNSSTTDPSGGYELYGFMPKEMLSKLGTITGTDVAPKAYGLDASVIPWVKDEGTPGKIEAGDHVYLYFGAGRGGRLYYGLDATSRTSPKMLWSSPLKGGDGGAFNELGYTTADPVYARINMGGTAHDVLVISGGYDLNEENMPTSASDTMGRAIYIVDATSGDLLWRGGPTGSGANQIFSAMNYAIPSAPRVLDMNGDGYSDRMYIADLGGQLWRFDIDNSALSANGLVKGGVIADLGLTADEQTAGKHRRKFFNTPDVALINDKANGAYLAINIGSGNRSHPVQDTYTNDMFFSIRDRHVFDTPDDYTTDYGIDLSKLVDVTNTVSPTIPANSKGWYLKMRDGEKVLAESRTFENQVMFTSYQPDSGIGSDACKPNLGIGRVYAMDVRNSKPIDDVNNNNVEETDDRDQELKRSGIPPEVVVLFPEASDGRPVALVGPELANVKLGNTRYRTYWTDKENEN